MPTVPIFSRQALSPFKHRELIEAAERDRLRGGRACDCVCEYPDAQGRSWPFTPMCPSFGAQIESVSPNGYWL